MNRATRPIKPCQRCGEARRAAQQRPLQLMGVQGRIWVRTCEACKAYCPQVAGRGKLADTQCLRTVRHDGLCQNAQRQAWRRGAAFFEQLGDVLVGTL